MKNEEAQRLLGDDLPTDSKTTTTTKGYSSGVRLSVAFGTCAFLLLGVVFFADRGGGGKINTNIVHNTIRSSGKDTSYLPSYCQQTGDHQHHITSGICDTSGIYDQVLPFLDHQKVIPGKIYYGLDFTDSSHLLPTYTHHYPPHAGKPFLGYSPCDWGDGKSVGRCMWGMAKVDDGSTDVLCPSPQRQIVHAWQECAELCNDAPACHTFTVRTQKMGFDHRDFHCYFHKSYECKHEKNKAVGIDHYVHHEDIRDAKYDDLGVWSGICRTISGRTSDYACSKTPHP